MYCFGAFVAASPLRSRAIWEAAHGAGAPRGSRAFRLRPVEAAAGFHVACNVERFARRQRESVQMNHDIDLLRPMIHGIPTHHQVRPDTAMRFQQRHFRYDLRAACDPAVVEFERLELGFGLAEARLAFCFTKEFRGAEFPLTLRLSEQLGFAEGGRELGFTKRVFEGLLRELSLECFGLDFLRDLAPTEFFRLALRAAGWAAARFPLESELTLRLGSGIRRAGSGLGCRPIRSSGGLLLGAGCRSGRSRGSSCGTRRSKRRLRRWSDDPVRRQPLALLEAPYSAPRRRVHDAGD